MRNLSYKIQSKKTNYNCYFCGKETKQRSNLFTHLRSHLKERPYKCGKCAADFLFPIRLKEHQVLKHPTPGQIENALKCDYCKDERIFLLKKKLKQHITEVHSERKHKCSYCHKAFSNRSKLEEHCRTHTKEALYSCYFCWTTFLTPRGHLLHMLGRHLKEYPLKCDKCSYRTYDISVLETHKHKTHPDTDKNAGKQQCNVCKLWVRATYLFHHVQKVHGGLKINPYICYFCGYRCIPKFRYHEHISIHTRERPLQCEVCCTFRAYRKEQLTRHHQNFHEKTSRYVCPKCPQGFVFAKDLASHLEEVHEMVCNPKLIARKCATVEQLRQMYKVQKSKKCYFCQQSFTSKQCDFERHIFCHTKERPYMCRICSYSTREHNMLSKHNRLMHN